MGIAFLKRPHCDPLVLHGNSFYNACLINDHHEGNNSNFYNLHLRDTQCSYGIQVRIDMEVLTGITKKELADRTWSAVIMVSLAVEAFVPNSQSLAPRPRPPT